MERILTTERVVFPTEGLEYIVKGLTNVGQLAIIRERSKCKGRVDEGLLMIRSLEAGVIEPRMTEQSVTDLMKAHPEVALQLAVRIAKLTTG